MSRKRRNNMAEDAETASALKLPVEDIPEYLLKCLNTYKISKETIELTLKLDTNMDFTFGEIWVFVTPEDI